MAKKIPASDSPSTSELKEFRKIPTSKLSSPTKVGLKTVAVSKPEDRMPSLQPNALQALRPGYGVGMGDSVAGAKPIKLARALNAVELSMQGYTQEAIAEMTGSSISTVRRDISYANRNGMISATDDKLLDLAQRALEAYTTALSGDDPDLFVAKDVLGHYAKIAQRTQDKKVKEEEMDLNAYFKARDLARKEAKSVIPTEEVDAYVVYADAEIAGSALPLIEVQGEGFGVQEARPKLPSAETDEN